MLHFIEVDRAIIVIAHYLGYLSDSFTFIMPRKVNDYICFQNIMVILFLFLITYYSTVAALSPSATMSHDIRHTRCRRRNTAYLPPIDDGI